MNAGPWREWSYGLRFSPSACGSEAGSLIFRATSYRRGVMLVHLADKDVAAGPTTIVTRCDSVSRAALETLLASADFNRDRAA